MGFNGDMHIYMVWIKERCVHLGKCESTRSSKGHEIVRVFKCCLRFLYFFVGQFPSKGALVRFEVI
jgi:hypothetical protein